MSTQQKATAGEVFAGAGPPPPPQQQPTLSKNHQPPQPPVSLYARKLLQKLSTLHPGASSESRQAIASWIIFNRKKCDPIGEGLLASIMECSASSSSGKGLDAEANNINIGRLMLILSIIHQVLVSNCPTSTTPSSAATGSMGEEGTADIDTWNKSSQLRVKLGEIVILPLWKALAMALNGMNATDRHNVYHDEIGSMLEEWKVHDVFGGPTVWEEYKRAWNRALREVNTTFHETEGGLGGAESNTLIDSNTEKTNANVEVDASNEPARQEEQAPGTIETSLDIDEDTTNMTSSGFVSEAQGMKGDADEKTNAASHSSPAADESGEGKSAKSTKHESVASINVAIDFEGVEEAKVEPSQFLDACKVIASLQITRDLGSDAAMNVASALSSIPLEVVEACNTILAQQLNGQDKITPIADLLSTESLLNLPDEVLDIDINYARNSLQMYKEAVRKQRTARMQLLQLLLQSRCSFGSVDAARTFYGGDKGDINVILEQLKKRKETLVDAMALEGLDVEEDEEAKKLAREEFLTISWFPGEDNDTEIQLADKRLRTC